MPSVLIQVIEFLFPIRKVLGQPEEAKALWQQIKHLNRSEVAGHWCKIEEDVDVLMQNLDLE